MEIKLVNKFSWIAYHLKAIEGLLFNAKIKYPVKDINPFDYEKKYKMLKSQQDYILKRLNYQLGKIRMQLPDIPEVRKKVFKKEIENEDLQFVSADKIKGVNNATNY